ncbi:MAG: nucleotide exchange factor GrpE [Patescibacteria group bacterium]
MKDQFEHFQLSQKIVLYSEQSKKFLLLKASTVGSEYVRKYGLWDLPGGRLQKNEDLRTALERELKEEVGDIEYTLGDVIYACTMTLQEDDPGDPYRVKMFYLATCDEQNVILSEEHTEFVWKSLEEIENDTNCKDWLKNAVRNAVIHLKAQENTNDALRIQAEFENYKKRQAAQQKDLGGYLIERLVLDIIPVLDNFRSATLHVPTEQKDSPWVVGIQYIEKQLESVLTDNGMQTIEVKEGEEFDPKIHEAVDAERQNQESLPDRQAGGIENQEESHKIAKVIQKGYKFGERVIRPAKVIVK